MSRCHCSSPASHRRLGHCVMYIECETLENIVSQSLLLWTLLCWWNPPPHVHHCLITATYHKAQWIPAIEAFNPIMHYIVVYWSIVIKSWANKVPDPNPSLRRLETARFGDLEILRELRTWRFCEIWGPTDFENANQNHMARRTVRFENNSRVGQRDFHADKRPCSFDVSNPLQGGALSDATVEFLRALGRLAVVRSFIRQWQQ